jgi:hypothetical protein
MHQASINITFALFEKAFISDIRMKVTDINCFDIIYNDTNVGELTEIVDSAFYVCHC